MKRRDQAAFLDRLWRLEAALVDAGFPAMPQWWRDTITRFYLSGKRRLIVRKGRRVFASTCVAPRLAVAEMLFGGHQHLPGTPPNMYVFLSVKRGEAAKRLRGITAILDVVGEKYTQAGETVELDAHPAIFAVMTANFRTNVGDTVAFAWCDEVARWRDDAALANPAEQVIGSLSPALATLPDAPMFLVSSPLGFEDYHAAAFDRGETEGQCVAFGATWTINPTLTRAACEAMEPDPKLFAREYAAIPQATSSPAFNAEHWLACFREVPKGCKYHQALGVLDSAAGKSARSDQMTWATLQYAIPPAVPEYLFGQVPATVYSGDTLVTDHTDTTFGVLCDDDGQPLRNPEANNARTPLLVMSGVDSVGGMFQGGLVSGELWTRIGRFFSQFNVSRLVADSYGVAMTKKELLPFGVQVTGVDWKNADKSRAVYRLRALMADGALILPQHEKLKAEGLAFTERILASGAVKFDARGSGKDDHVDLLINAILGEEMRLLPGSNMHAPNYRHEAPGR